VAATCSKSTFVDGKAERASLMKRAHGTRAKVASEVGILCADCGGCGLTVERIGVEAVAIPYSLLAEAGMPVICVETRHMKAALSAQLRKSARNDPRGINHVMRVGLYRPVHVKTLASQIGIGHRR
jgi:transposase